MSTTIKSMSHAEFKKLLQQHASTTTYCQTPAGMLRVHTIDAHVYKAEFISEEETENIPKNLIQKNISAAQFFLVGTPFQCAVWRAALQIPAGTTVSYTDIAQMVNAPRAVRAVANALGDNNIAYFVPCHRVLRKSGELCGYNWNIERKKMLLESERIGIKSFRF